VTIIYLRMGFSIQVVQKILSMTYDASIDFSRIKIQRKAAHMCLCVAVHMCVYTFLCNCVHVRGERKTERDNAHLCFNHNDKSQVNQGF
jgi:hypothetical protein